MAHAAKKKSLHHECAIGIGRNRQKLAGIEIRKKLGDSDSDPIKLRCAAEEKLNTVDSEIFARLEFRELEKRVFIFANQPA